MNKMVVEPSPMIGHGNSDVIIESVQPDKKIVILKELRDITGYDLYAVKYIIEKTPYLIMQNVDEEYAINIKSRLEILGATVEVKESENNI